MQLNRYSAGLAFMKRHINGSSDMPFNSRIWEVERGESEFDGQPQLTYQV